MTAYSWLAGSGNWNVAAKWTPGGGPPQSTDTATISAGGSLYTITVDSADAAASLTLSSASATLDVNGALTIGGALNFSNGALTLESGGVLNLGGTLSQTGGALTLAGGTIVGGTINATGGTLAFTGGTLNGVTFDGPLNLTSNTSAQELHLANGTTVVGTGGSGSGTINVTGDQNPILFLDNTQTVSNETINLGNLFNGRDFLSGWDTTGAGQTLTLASSVTINVVGNADISYGQASGDRIVNQGLIHQTAGKLTIDGTAFTNSGTIDVGNGASLTIDPTETFTTATSSVIMIEANSSVTIHPIQLWTNLGLITVASGAHLNLAGGGDLGSVRVSGGVVFAAGTYSSSGNFIEGAGSSINVGFLNLYGTTSLSGRVVGGGTLELGGSATVNSGAALSVATWQVYDLLGTGSSVTIGENLTYAGKFTEGAGATVRISASDALTLSGTSSIGGAVRGAGTLKLAGGSATIASGAALTVANWTVSGTGTTVTLGANLSYGGTFSAGAGATLNLSSGNLTLTGKNAFAGATMSGFDVLYAIGATTVSGLTIGGTTTFNAWGAVSESGGSATLGDSSGNLARLNIASTGTWDFLDDSGINRGTSTSSAIINSGLLEKTGGAGTSVIAPIVTNNGVNTGGAAVNAGILVSSGALDFKGTVQGTGTDTILGATTLEFDSSVSSPKTLGGQNIVFAGGGGGTLDLTSPTGFYGEISGFAASDAIDLLGSWALSGYSDVSGVTTLTLTSGAIPHAFAFVGDYAQSAFHIASGTTTIITHT